MYFGWEGHYYEVQVMGKIVLRLSLKIVGAIV